MVNLGLGRSINRNGGEIMNIKDIISELKSHLDSHTGINRGLLSTAISNLELVAKNAPALRRSFDIEPEICYECRPGNPCYGHGHY